MHSKRLRLLATACLCLLASSTQATLVERDLTDHANSSLNGRGRLTFDSASNLEWLDWTLTTGRSFADVSSQLGSSGDFAGFRYATDSEIQALFTNLWSRAISFPSGNAVLTGQDYKHAITLFGETQSDFFTAAVNRLDDSGTFAGGPMIRSSLTFGRSDLLFPDGGGSSIGHALVRNAAIVAVPEVGSVTCFAVVAFLLACFGRRRMVDAIA